MFKVPIIPPDLRHEETIIQAAYALDCLQTTIVTIFERIDNRIEKNNIKVNELRERIKKSQAKIMSLHGSSKAIRIYAPARFPATNIFKDLPVTFNEEEISVQKSPPDYRVESKLDTHLPSINDKLVFFHVRDQKSEKLAPSSSLAKERCNIKQMQDLGNVPSDLRSIASVLLFNTNASAYNLEESYSEASRQSDAWKRTRLTKSKRLHGNNQLMSAKQILEPAPYSLVHRRNEMLTPSGGLKYTPKLSDAPELNLPMDLPDLPGIANDLRYESLEAKQKIAPSLAFTVEDLPELTELLKESDKSTEILSEKDNDNNVTPVAPPPPPPMPIKQFPAPTPPPPPPSKELQVAQVEKNVTNRKSSVSPTSGDTRSELMAAIRNAGGIAKARLRPTAAAPLVTNDSDVVDNTLSTNSSTKKASVSQTSQGGDLMADLHNKLLMRRKGISGAKENRNENSDVKGSSNSVPSGNPVISRLSALIPPPPASKQKARNAAATSEEDDEDDSNDTDWVD